MNTAPNWTSLAWRGFVSILFGVLALSWPGMTLAALILLFGAYAFVDGALALAVAMQRGRRPHRGLLVADGVFGIVAGVLTFIWPGLTLLALVILVGVRSLFMGAVQIAAAIRLRRSLPMPVLYGLGGVASIILAVAAFVVPGITAYALVTMLAVYSMIFGGILLALAVVIWRSTPHGVPATLR
jgi:uncharacterized membrane protein HdeD (DUF308 family)